MVYLLLRTHALTLFRESSHRLLYLNIYLLAILLLIPLPNTGLDSQDRMGNVCAMYMDNLVLQV